MPFPIDITVIAETEQTLGLTFPPRFKARMCLSNGGELCTKKAVWQLFPFWDKSSKKHISRTANHIIIETEQAKKWIGFPHEAIAIAANGFGDLLILLPSAKSSKQLGEKLYVWSHETGKIRKVADTIDALDFPSEKRL
ncbi:SMI1/KNR4 family protein [Suttonella sp. R2A3]|uniref:SMI1/KNR4 family protein n=1 Tax=Suttonella sp. R2A3 TaxID=2908648 RepID=UPI001F30C36E|nr:SMI1/KNR4 family protein [Suttonella sp. R2A3]UJF25225.1 SMI1/KNR4 family protein [Suttonella sp. R2A3]